MALVIGVSYAADLLRLIGASETLVAEGKGFTAMLLGGSASILYLFLLNTAFTGAGDTYTPSPLNFVCFWILQIPLGYWLAAPMEFGPNDVFLSLVIAESVLTVLGVLIFRSGKWKTQQV